MFTFILGLMVGLPLGIVLVALLIVNGGPSGDSD